METALAQANPGAFIGPLMLGPFFQSMLQGVLVVLTWTYYTRAKTEHIIVKLLVGFVTLASLVQTAGGLYESWAYFVTGFGNWDSMTGLYWPEEFQTVYTATMAAPIQSYYIYRCWKVTNRNWIILGFLSALLASNWACACKETVYVFRFWSGPPPVLPPIIPGVPPPVFKIPLDLVFIYYLVSSGVIDICISVVLLSYLLRSKAKAGFDGLNATINRLVNIIWQTALPPCICAIATAIIYIVMVRRSVQNVDLFFQQMLGKLYCISLLVTLNARMAMTNSRNNTTYEMGTPWSRPGDFKSSVRVDVRTTVDEGQLTTQIGTMQGPEHSNADRKVRYLEQQRSFVPGNESDEKVNTSIV